MKNSSEVLKENFEVMLNFFDLIFHDYKFKNNKEFYELVKSKNYYFMYSIIDKHKEEDNKNYDNYVVNNVKFNKSINEHYYDDYEFIYLKLLNDVSDNFLKLVDKNIIFCKSLSINNCKDLIKSISSSILYTLISYLDFLNRGHDIEFIKNLDYKKEAIINIVDYIDKIILNIENEYEKDKNSYFSKSIRIHLDKLEDLFFDFKKQFDKKF